MTSSRNLLFITCALGAFAGCRVMDMDDQPKHHPLEPSSFFADGRSSRLPVADTVAQGPMKEDDPLLYTGKVGKADATVFPFPITEEVLKRGQERFNIYCAVCHGRTGDGEGMVVKRGFPHPPSYHIDRMRQAPVGHYFDVMTNGFGMMYSYADRVSVKDRWAIIAYIRALQRSQNASLADVPPAERAALQKGQP